MGKIAPYYVAIRALITAFCAVIGVKWAGIDVILLEASIVGVLTALASAYPREKDE
jgi:hypothetical protein